MLPRLIEVTPNKNICSKMEPFIKLRNMRGQNPSANDEVEIATMNLQRIGTMLPMAPVDAPHCDICAKLHLFPCVGKRQEPIA
jgi:hypothetical protein